MDGYEKCQYAERKFCLSYSIIYCADNLEQAEWAMREARLKLAEALSSTVFDGKTYTIYTKEKIEPEKLPYVHNVARYTIIAFVEMIETRKERHERIFGKYY